ncbi:hypothetical protein KKG83_00705 [Candidatus Micrarchaeota archaeon]|nr:hypothetical protein [Candidatus Micrarchaeota archaeon]MBU2475970.1 hypothetical protein [Candidatus Micrarchaeota archaeon]
MISEFLKENFSGFNYGNFIVTKIQLTLILMLLTGFAFYFAEIPVIAAVQVILSAVFFHALLIEAKKKFSSDFKYFVLVFGSMYAVIQMVWIMDLILPPENRIDAGFGLIFVLVVVAVIFSVLLKKKETEAVILSSNGKVTVIETEFDLRSFNKGGKYIVETEKKFSEGKKVNVKIHKSFFGKKIELI